ncbi:MAG: adventurous gliding motility protein CglE [Myxococcota bacterium]
MRIAFALGLLSLSAPAFAQDDLDAPGSESAAEGKRKARTFDDDVVREVVRGYYLKSNIGSAALAPLAQGVQMSGVMALGLGVGSDFIDKERLSAAWEIQVQQALFNGPPADQLPALPPVVEGDIHTFSGTAVVEVSGYVTRRTGFGVRGGGGVMFAPLLITQEAYADVTPIWGQEAAMHAGPLPLAILGGTFEYYTKLSHFSIGADADVAFVIPHALAANYGGYLKYTF